MSDHEDSNGFRVFEAQTAADLERQLNQWADEWHKEPDRFLQVRRTQLAAGPGRLVALVNFNIKRRPKRAEVTEEARACPQPCGAPECATLCQRPTVPAARSGYCDNCGGKRWCPRCER